jgi:NADH:ubiquinone oxidoreductase subunit
MIHLGTVLFTAFFGEKVGTDEFGNKYYRTKKKNDTIGMYKKERRWVMYNGRNEPSKVPALWHGWLHYTFDEVPTEEDQKKQHEWQKSHLPNLTGTAYAYLPKGHVAAEGKRDKATGDYEAWKPE